MNKNQRMNVEEKRVIALSRRDACGYADGCADIGLKPEDEFLAEQAEAEKMYLDSLVNGQLSKPEVATRYAFSQDKRIDEYAFFVRTALRVFPPLGRDEKSHSSAIVHERLRNIRVVGDVIDYALPAYSRLSHLMAGNLVLEVQSDARLIGEIYCPEELALINESNERRIGEERFRRLTLPTR